MSEASVHAVEHGVVSPSATGRARVAVLPLLVPGLGGQDKA